MPTPRTAAVRRERELTEERRAADRAVGASAGAFRRSLRHGDPVATILFPRCGRRATIRAGFDQETIDRGPGWYSHSALPGEGRLVYLAGHNRTHGAPFRCVHFLRAGDTVIVRVPYAIATYAVARHRLVRETDVSVLRGDGRERLRLQTSTDPPGRWRQIAELRPVAIVRR